MKLSVTGFIYFLKLSLLLRGILAFSLDDDECTENEDSDYTDESSIALRTSEKRYTKTATSIVYVYSPQTSFNSLMGLDHPTTILVASTYIEILTITPGLVHVKESYMLSDKGTTDIPTITNESSFQIISSCFDCTTLSSIGRNTNTKSLELISKPKNSYSPVTSPGSSIAVSSASITSMQSHPTRLSSHSSSTNSSKSKSAISRKPLSRTGLTYSCDASICSSTDFTNSATRNVHTLTSVSKNSTKSLKNKTQTSTKEKNHKTSYIQSSLMSTSVATTSYHYYDSASIKHSLHAPIFLALLLLDIISF